MFDGSSSVAHFACVPSACYRSREPFFLVCYTKRQLLLVFFHYNSFLLFLKSADRLKAFVVLLSVSMWACRVTSGCKCKLLLQGREGKGKEQFHVLQLHQTCACLQKAAFSQDFMCGAGAVAVLVWYQTKRHQEVLGGGLCSAGLPKDEVTRILSIMQSKHSNHSRSKWYA